MLIKKYHRQNKMFYNEKKSIRYQTYVNIRTYTRNHESLLIIDHNINHVFKFIDFFDIT